MRDTITTTMMMMALAGLAPSGCLVQLPGNLDGGEAEDGMTGDSDGDDMSGDGDGMAGDGDGMTGDGDGMSGDGDGDGDPEPGLDGDGCQEAVDILLIVDNSATMAAAQRRLADSLEALLVPLDQGGVDWRLAITTTDVGHDWCPEPGEMGQFQIQACNEHLDDFMFDAGTLVDMSDLACNDICPYAPDKLHTLPSTTAEDPEAKPRPWLERIDGVSNLSDDVDLLAATRCLVPQGISGCGFEQPLEAMDLALDRATSPGNPESGFLRDEASLLVVIVTDEVDCSYADEAIFDPNGNRVFFTNPDDAFPTSGVCWNAGVHCLGEGPDYDECVAASYGVEGDFTMPDLAVLHPVYRYRDRLTELEQQKRALDPGADVGVLVIAGLGTDGLLHYSDVGDSDPDFQDAFGIGPGCTAPPPMGSDEPIRAVPPVRLRELGVTLSSEPLASICDEDYLAPFSAAQDRLLGSCG